MDSRIVSSVLCRAEEHRQQLVALVQRLVRTSSPSGAEGEVGYVFAAALEQMGYDKVWIDAAGNVIARLQGNGTGPSLMLNGHLDHVPPQGMDDPYSGELLDGEPYGASGQVIYGRGACDMKGALTAMALAGVLVRGSGIPLRGDIYVTASVREELGGDGTRELLRTGPRPDFVLVCDQSNLRIALGQRGTVNVGILVGGLSCHSSMPELGHNALYRAARLISAIETRLAGNLPAHPIFGPASLAVTNLTVYPGVINVVPGECGITINVRNHPGYPAEQVLEACKRLVSELQGDDPDLVAHVFFVRPDQASFAGFYTPPDEPLVQEAQRAVQAVTGTEPEFTVWRFGSDARHFAAAGIPTCGLGPGDPQVAHSTFEYVAVDELVTASQVYALLGLRICG